MNSVTTFLLEILNNTYAAKDSIGQPEDLHNMACTISDARNQLD